jgi:hypothetical protein
MEALTTLGPQEKQKPKNKIQNFRRHLDFGIVRVQAQP